MQSKLTDQQKQVVRLLAPLFAAFEYVKYGNEEKLKEKMRVFAIALEDLDSATLSAGILKCIRTKTFPPTIAEIREECASVITALTSSGAKSIDEAWGEVRKQVHDCFIYKKPVFSTPEIKDAAEKMGWATLCAATDSEMVGNRAQFIKLYESILRRKREEKANSDIISALGGVDKIKSLASTGAKLSLVSGGAR